MKITYTNIIMIGAKLIRFDEMTKKEQDQVGNRPLETLGNVTVKNPA